MSTQLTRLDPPVSAAPALTGQEMTSPVRPPSAARPRGRILFWWVFAAAVALTVGVLTLGYSLVASVRQTRELPPAERLAIPFAALDWDACRQWMVQDDGRDKPFDSYCREIVRSITGRERFEGNDPVAVVVSWLLLYEADRTQAEQARKQAGCDWERYPFILCDYQPLREAIYRDVRGDPTEEELHGRHLAPADIRNSVQFQELLREAMAARRKNSKAVLPPLQAKVLQVSNRLDQYDRAREGASCGIVALDECAPVWFPLAEVRRHCEEPLAWRETLRQRKAQFLHLYEGQPAQEFPGEEAAGVLTAFAAWQQAYRSGDEAAFAGAAARFFDTTAQVSGAHQPPPAASVTEMELWYNRTVPFQKAWIFSLLAAVVLGASILLGTRWQLAGRVFYAGGLLAFGGALALSVVGFWCRVSISGRPPVSNMYESVIWVAFMCAAFGFALELVYRQGVIALAGALVSTLGFVLADQLPLTLDPKISPLVAVLRSNYWLIIHVLTIVSSYAAFALAWGLGNLNLGLILFSPGRQDLIKTLSLFCYRAIQLGVLLLFAGTMLGGWWAAESWGRFWGWDPKEVWALIAFLCYIIPLHARYVGWVKDFGLAVCAVVCFASVVMAWYGVNFVLAAGLHSYGFGGGNNLWVTWAALVNIDLVLIAALSHLYFQGRARAAAV